MAQNSICVNADVNNRDVTTTSTVCQNPAPACPDGYKDDIGTECVGGNSGYCPTNSACYGAWSSGHTGTRRRCRRTVWPTTDNDKYQCCMGLKDGHQCDPSYCRNSISCDDFMRNTYCKNNPAASACACMNRYSNPNTTLIETEMQRRYGVPILSVCWLKACGDDTSYVTIEDQNSKTQCPHTLCSISDININGDVGQINFSNSCGGNAGTPAPTPPTPPGTPPPGGDGTTPPPTTSGGFNNWVETKFPGDNYATLRSILESFVFQIGCPILLFVLLSCSVYFLFGRSKSKTESSQGAESSDTSETVDNPST